MIKKRRVRQCRKKSGIIKEKGKYGKVVIKDIDIGNGSWWNIPQRIRILIFDIYSKFFRAKIDVSLD